MKTTSNNTGPDSQGPLPAAEPAMAAATFGAAVPGEFNRFLADIEDLIEATTSLTGDDLARAKAKLSARVVAAKQSVQQMGGVIADRARHTAKVTNGYVHQHPWQAVGVGAALGLLLGFALARRK